ncbi:hypothetical protein MGYG_08427 [Nannizzia gypsea CBS 118893]|uniref:Uncharacterized protein n=1 Tax=Arthroderma gypseum (strain ATCC MYA-4604 / CBS 118893) TaxID=535722 RepID=E4V5P0_ARTGP|nr:hypothetical protein MGYG_08427 [Nannizzia gypsea CBS 118893]EFR05415.1 hypothetical protein MGYG_08427 [Nannizzia gypsea CBS 118893]
MAPNWALDMAMSKRLCINTASEDISRDSFFPSTIPQPNFPQIFNHLLFFCSPLNTKETLTKLNSLRPHPVMSRAVADFFKKARKEFNLAKKFRSIFSPGSRILPSRTSKNDTKFQLRIDAGELINNRYRQLILQVNSQATTPGLRDWVKKYGTHAKLAEERFDTLAEDPEAEVERVVESLEGQAKTSLKN